MKYNKQFDKVRLNYVNDAARVKSVTYISRNLREGSRYIDVEKSSSLIYSLLLDEMVISHHSYAMFRHLKVKSQNSFINGGTMFRFDDVYVPLLQITAFANDEMIDGIGNILKRSTGIDSKGGLANCTVLVREFMRLTLLKYRDYTIVEKKCVFDEIKRMASLNREENGL